MAMSYVWVILLFVSVVFGALTGSAGAVGAAAVQGAESAVELTLSLAGPMIFYSALLEVMERSGLTEKLSRANFAMSEELSMPARISRCARSKAADSEAIFKNSCVVFTGAGMEWRASM